MTHTGKNESKEIKAMITDPTTCALFPHSRWQPADEAADPRYVGDIGMVAPKYGLFGKEQEKVQKVEDLKQLWGI